MFLIPLSYAELEKLQVHQVPVALSTFPVSIQRSINIAIECNITYCLDKNGNAITYSDPFDHRTMEIRIMRALLALKLDAEVALPRVRRRNKYEYDIEVLFYRKSIRLRDLVKIPAEIRICK